MLQTPEDDGAERRPGWISMEKVKKLSAEGAVFNAVCKQTCLVHMEELTESSIDCNNAYLCCSIRDIDRHFLSILINPWIVKHSRRSEGRDY